MPKVILVLLIAALSAAAQTCKGSLSESSLTDLVKNKVAASVIDGIIRKCGISFSVTPAAMKRIRAAGAAESTVAALNDSDAGRRRRAEDSKASAKKKQDVEDERQRLEAARLETERKQRELDQKLRQLEADRAEVTRREREQAERDQLARAEAARARQAELDRAIASSPGLPRPILERWAPISLYIKLPTNDYIVIPNPEGRIAGSPQAPGILRIQENGQAEWLTYNTHRFTFARIIGDEVHCGSTVRGVTVIYDLATGKELRQTFSVPMKKSTIPTKKE